MASQTPVEGPFGNRYRTRIGELSTNDEVWGYRIFAIGLIMGLGGIGLIALMELDPSQFR